jgi:hypothetical protein
MQAVVVPSGHGDSPHYRFQRWASQGQPDLNLAESQIEPGVKITLR